MNKSLIDFSSLSSEFIFSLFRQASINKKNLAESISQQDVFNHKMRGTAGLLFFEPSTRTRFSFQTACARQGVHPLVMDSFQGTSLEKGESVEDTILNLAAMKPHFFIVRCADSIPLKEISDHLDIPIINAGWGVRAHPTQALLDIFTLFEKWNELSEKKILFIGDVKHSRVFSSHRQLAKILGYQLAFCAPDEFSFNENESTGLLKFESVEEGLCWADAVVTLRVQNERHDLKQTRNTNLHNYASLYGINEKRTKLLKKEGLILHPGPINYGVEIEREVLKDSRSVVLQLVENGVFIREVIIQKILAKEILGE